MNINKKKIRSITYAHSDVRNRFSVAHFHAKNQKIKSNRWPVSARNNPILHGIQVG